MNKRQLQDLLDAALACIDVGYVILTLGIPPRPVGMGAFNLGEA